MGAFKNLADKISENISDMLELEVNTFTGSITAEIDQPEGEDKKKLRGWNDILDTAEKGGNIQMAFGTRMKADGDQDLFFSDEAPQRVYEAHKAAVEAGIQWRQGIFQFVAQFLKSD